MKNKNKNNIFWLKTRKVLTNKVDGDIIKSIQKRTTETNVWRRYLSKKTILYCLIRLKIETTGGWTHGQFDISQLSIC